MDQTQLTYELDERVRIISDRSVQRGKTGVITGIFCAGLPRNEQYVVRIDGERDATRVYHFRRDEIEPVHVAQLEVLSY